MSLSGPWLTSMDLDIKTYDMLGLDRTDGFLVITPYFSSSNDSLELVNKANLYYTMTLAFITIISTPFSLALCALVYV